MKTLKLKKADIKDTKKCVVIKQYIQARTIRNSGGCICYDGDCCIIEYTSGISTGEAIFPCNEIGSDMMKKFLKLLNK